MLKISGIQKLTLLDYPGLLACTLFLNGCNFRCPFCHNSALVTENDSQEISYEDLLKFLEKRKSTLEGVCITGGEPLLNDDIESLLVDIKKLGYKIKLDTNGSRPEKLKQLVEKNLVDYVAMDIKNCYEKYPLTIGKKEFDISKIEESINYLLKESIPYEFRTTVVREYHTANDFKKIGVMIENCRAYFLQLFVDSGNIIESGLHPCTKEQMYEYLGIVKAYIPNATLRGI